MSIFCYILERPSFVSNIEDIKQMIIATSHQVPSKLYACINNEQKITAYKLCCQNDINVLKDICKDNPITILYTPYIQNLPIPFKGFRQAELKSFPACDFYILETQGIQDGTDVDKGENLQKLWKIRIIGQVNQAMIKCIEGDFFGVQGKIHVENSCFNLEVSVKAPMISGWSSSIWRVFTNNNPFGPWLFIEVNVK